MNTHRPVCRSRGSAPLGGLLVLLLAGALAPFAPAAAPPPAPRVEVLDQIVAVKDLCAWPKLALLPNGDVVAAVYNQPSHGLKPGEVDLYASTDGGRTWAKRGTPTRRPAGAFGRLNHAVGVARDGAVHVVSGGWEYDGPGPKDSYKKKKLLRPEASRSTDGGRTWKFGSSFPDGADGMTLVPFGNVEAGADGVLRVAAYSYNTAVKPRVDICYVIESRDQGLTWTRGGVVGQPTANETDLLHLGSGRWLAAARNLGRNGQPGHAIDIHASDDDARTWRKLAEPTAGNQHPGDLLKLADGRVLLVFGDRRPGHIGVGAMISGDGGRTWSDGVPLAVGVLTRDSGYPSSVQLADGTIVTGFYGKTKAYSEYQLGVVRWRLR